MVYKMGSYNYSSIQLAFLPQQYLVVILLSNWYCSNLLFGESI